MGDLDQWEHQFSRKTDGNGQLGVEAMPLSRLRHEFDGALRSNAQSLQRANGAEHPFF
jgi:hypothetical protein